MAYLGRRGALAPVNSADIPDNSITGAKIVAGTIEASDVAADMATQAELDAQRTNSSITTLGTVTAGNLSNSAIVYPAGHILQVVSSIKSDTSTKTTDSFSTIPGTDQSASGSVWCAKITPVSTSSKVLVTVIVHVGHIMDSYPAFILYRNAVPLGVADSITSGTEVTFGGRVGGGDNTDADMNIYSYTYLDSPSLDTAITYQLEYSSMRTTTREIFINRSKSVGDANQMGASSTITLMEVAG